MNELWKTIGSPRHLMVFEAAARLGSFTAAAHEMNVQQPAVSAAIRQLETSLGVSLFTRAHRRVELTTAGARFFADVSGALKTIEKSAQSISRAHEKNHVTLNASTAFTYYWMMPRLKDLRDIHPMIDLRLQSSDREPDMIGEGIDLAIRRGTGDWSDCHSQLLAPERIFPVASPRVMASAKNLKSIPNLMAERLIHLEEPVRERPTWRDWFAHHNIKRAELSGGLRLNDYALVLQAAIAGEGFAFGWEHVTKGLLEQEILAARKEWTWDTGQGFYLVWSKLRNLPPHVENVRKWLLSAADT